QQRQYFAILFQRQLLSRADLSDQIDRPVQQISGNSRYRTEAALHRRAQPRMSQDFRRPPQIGDVVAPERQRHIAGPQKIAMVGHLAAVAFEPRRVPATEYPPLSGQFPLDSRFARSSWPNCIESALEPQK